MRNSIYIILISFLSLGCITDKTCSDDDKSCNPQALLTSYFSIQNGVYIYSTSTKYQGNLAAYGSTLEFSGQNICKSEKLFSSLVNQFCPDVWALISSDSVPLYDFSTSFSLPTNIPVFGPTGIQLANNWDEFMSIQTPLSLTRSLAEAGLGTEDFWSFAAQGGIASGNCNIGTDNTSEFFGAIGSANTKDSNWLSPGGESTGNCDSSHRVLCICFNPDTSSEEQQ
ncbi:hypothetical protein [Leptospira andrefontaineae]|uniref:DUF1554 domain-containing protein n=1 Tax=Leptospira andrefontaineae TaxID=2484976 RepID=A0A4R9HCG3_9LEPT|nr:hypothetical protein [Leptospira andrefontaineae]TGK44509.1 hypothetical protein EHO65_00275 [Leptospira andrefontaineae]